jgi:hypothetical protein
MKQELGLISQKIVVIFIMNITKHYRQSVLESAPCPGQ